MKKVLSLIIVVILTLTFDVFALEYKTVNVSATFSEEIEFSNIEKVILTIFGDGIDYVDDASSIVGIAELTQENNYTQTLNDVKIVDRNSLFAIVDKDNYGIYNCDYSLDTSLIDTANINIYISKNNIPKNEFSEIPSDILDKIIGNSTVNNNGENSNNNNSNSNNNNENNEIVIKTTTKTTTNEAIYKEELKKREEKEKKDTKKNNMVTIILFAIIGGILLVGLIFVVYKFINANK
ncbi:MAG: hypothetical protein J5982_02575 [Bacilli bacterium]|nr:hypothetical protein [Bacilli bacterium]